jgi:hypothetical protein
MAFHILETQLQLPGFLVRRNSTLAFRLDFWYAIIICRILRTQYAYHYLWRIINWTSTMIWLLRASFHFARSCKRSHYKIILSSVTRIQLFKIYRNICHLTLTCKIENPPHWHTILYESPSFCAFHRHATHFIPSTDTKLVITIICPVNYTRVGNFAPSMLPVMRGWY